MGFIAALLLTGATLMPTPKNPSVLYNVSVNGDAYPDIITATRTVDGTTSIIVQYGQLVKDAYGFNKISFSKPQTMFSNKTPGYAPQLDVVYDNNRKVQGIIVFYENEADEEGFEHLTIPPESILLENQNGTLRRVQIPYDIFTKST